MKLLFTAGSKIKIAFIIKFTYNTFCLFFVLFKLWRRFIFRKRSNTTIVKGQYEVKEEKHEKSLFKKDEINEEAI